MHQVNIQIAARPGTGKTAIAGLIANALKAAGFANVVVENNDEPLHPQSALDDIVACIAPNTAIVISEKHLTALCAATVSRTLLVPTSVPAVTQEAKRNFDVKLETSKFSVQVDTAAHYGYFEHNTLGDECGGGLWFDPQMSGSPDGIEIDTGKLTLSDYDGAGELPMEVITALRGHGFVVDKDFE